MSAILPSGPGSNRRQAFAILTFLGVTAGLIALSLRLAADLYDQADAVTAVQQSLASLEGNSGPDPAVRVADGDPQSAGSPFLEGRTITVAGAALQQRIDAAAAKAGGGVVSSQIDLDGPEAKQGFVSLTANIEVAQPGLQQLLYDLEAGMPYLFIDTLVVQAPQGFRESQDARMRVVLGVSGQWQAAR
jgi:general secretion pathway protein M